MQGWNVFGKHLLPLMSRSQVEGDFMHITKDITVYFHVLHPAKFFTYRYFNDLVHGSVSILLYFLIQFPLQTL